MTRRGDVLGRDHSLAQFSKLLCGISFGVIDLRKHAGDMERLSASVIFDFVRFLLWPLSVARPAIRQDSSMS
jgi:hypothetical protein